MKPLNNLFFSTLITLTMIFSIHAENTISEQNLDLVANDSVNAIQTIDKTSNTIKNEFKKIQFAAQIGADAVWCKYVKPMKEWHLFPWIGYSASALVDFNVVPAFTLEAGLRLSKTGDKLRADIDLDSTIITVPFIDTTLIDSSQTIVGYGTENIYSISFPVNLILNLKNSPVFLLAGIDIAYILYANSDIDYKSDNIKNSDNKNTDALNRLNTSLLFGTGCKLTIFSKCMAVRIDYRIGMTDIAKKNEWVTGFKSRDVTLSLLFYL
jgi:hypothetical protein